MNWKLPPSDKSKRWLNPSLELQILLACSWSCQSCDAFSQFHGISWVKKGTMTIAQIQHFIDEMKEQNAFLGRIRILGGEPTMHGKFQDIVRMLHAELVVTGHVGHLEVITNGDNPEKIEPVKHLIKKVRVSGEAAKQRSHTANLRATPRSLGYEGKRCGQPEFCGWSLSFYGYAPCSSGAGIMRLRDLMELQQRTSLPTEKGTEKTWPELQELCNDCYHGLRDEDKVKSGTGMKPGQHALNVPSTEVWENLAPWLHGKNADWPIYGQEARVPAEATA